MVVRKGKSGRKSEENLRCKEELEKQGKINDQLCNAKLIQDVWKIGVRVRINDEGIVEKDDLGRCIDVMKGEEYRKNAIKWKDLAKEAMKENGSSNMNLQAYVKEILLGHS
ncbi:hypothetical protein KY284_029817 [Solanum tuberosum]|nr:hypothetical protein KY284_029817 [Solanum tuberosum]